jgi:hypothetical protein
MIIKIDDTYHSIQCTILGTRLLGNNYILGNDYIKGAKVLVLEVKWYIPIELIQIQIDKYTANLPISFEGDIKVHWKFMGIIAGETCKYLHNYRYEKALYEPISNEAKLYCELIR